MATNYIPFINAATTAYMAYSGTLSFFDKLINIVEMFLANFVG